ncbi:hypothetical protein SLE2022_080130 [Rubroshorea leprosula]
MAVDFRSNQKILKEVAIILPSASPSRLPDSQPGPSHEAHPKGSSLGHLAQAAGGRARTPQSAIKTDDMWR